MSCNIQCSVVLAYSAFGNKLFPFMINFRLISNKKSLLKVFFKKTFQLPVSCGYQRKRVSGEKEFWFKNTFLIQNSFFLSEFLGAREKHRDFQRKTLFLVPKLFFSFQNSFFFQILFPIRLGWYQIKRIRFKNTFSVSKILLLFK